MNMVSSSMMSSSVSIKKSRKRTLSIDCLPQDILVEVSSCVAASSLSSVRNLRLVSKSFQQTCDDRYVISRLSLHETPLFHWNHNPERFSNFFKRCRKNGNPEALYRKGLINYFLENQKHKGLKLLTRAAEKGNHEANYVYGMILICLGDKGNPGGPALLGGNTKQKGFKILSGLIKPLMSTTLQELVELRDRIRDSILWRGIPVMKELKRAYVREKCECDGKTMKFVAYNCVWHRYGEDNDMNTSSACEFCLWHHEVELFFYNIE
ncbi:putative F-box protein At1g67623 [Eutrema salsugineum]|uniref:putative F-box protein At1g67623 n=1 Tax=Eutrema salsugineum TaxID=72664 RepID=UPI000CED6E80|nr:putative F-box protein At1g67623 [Eutrema salsugineum]